MKKINKTKNPFLIFLPFLVLYIVYVVICHTNGGYGDESRYLIYSRYMIDGHLPYTNLDFDHLGNGPGYSILLMPFTYFHLPIIVIHLLNALLYYFSVILVFKNSITFISFKRAISLSIFWACYANSFNYMGKILPEIFSSFLICLLMFSVINAFTTEKPQKYIYLSGFVFGFLALTKPVFGYVMLCMLIFSFIFWVLKRDIKVRRMTLLILIIALATTTPYLVHSYKETGRFFYWSSLGGNNLYWATEPDEFEYGSWFPAPGMPVDPATEQTHLPNFKEQVRAKHAKDFEEINKYKGTAQDDAYKRMAIKNISEHPAKFLQNCMSNIGRLLFNFPYSYKIQSPYTLLRLPLNGIIVVFALICLIPTLKNWKKIIFPIRFMILLALIYLGGSILGSAETRMFTLVVPIILIWIAFVLQHCVRINLGKWGDEL